jgi:hypothetical protein
MGTVGAHRRRVRAGLGRGVDGWPMSRYGAAALLLMIAAMIAILILGYT